VKAARLTEPERSSVADGRPVGAPVGTSGACCLAGGAGCLRGHVVLEVSRLVRDALRPCPLRIQREVRRNPVQARLPAGIRRGPELFAKAFLKPCEPVRHAIGLLMFEFSRFWPTDYEYGRNFIADLDKFPGQLPKGWPVYSQITGWRGMRFLRLPPCGSRLPEVSSRAFGSFKMPR
jgi:hypothetical protein